MAHIILILVVIVPSNSIPQVVFVVAFVPVPSISPEKFARSVHLSSLELALIVRTIFELHNTFALDLVVVFLADEMTLISDPSSKIDGDLNFFADEVVLFSDGFIFDFFLLLVEDESDASLIGAGD